MAEVAEVSVVVDHVLPEDSNNHCLFYGLNPKEPLFSFGIFTLHHQLNRSFNGRTEG